MRWITLLLALITALVADRTRLALENIALRQQITVLKRSVNRPQIQDSDRVFWILIRHLLDGWRDALLIVKPKTVIKWHRKGWRYFWRRKSLRGSPGRPTIGKELIELIQRMSRDNVTWGAPRIHSELALLGYDVAESTVAKYMVRHPRTPTQTWRTFMANHMPVAAACDFFVIPTLTFKPLYCFVVISHERRTILHVNVTTHPTDEWTARQIIEAFPGDGLVPDYVHRDRDSVYGSAFRRTTKALDVTEVISAKQSPWQNPFAERVVGSIRRECTDHTRPSRASARWFPAIALGERHLAHVLRRYATYYNESRTHLSLDRNSPLPRSIEKDTGTVVAVPPCYPKTRTARLGDQSVIATVAHKLPRQRQIGTAIRLRRSCGARTTCAVAGPLLWHDA